MKKDKIISRLLTHPTDLTYKDVNSILCALGYSQIRSKGANRVYKKDNKAVSFHIPHRYETFQAYQVTKLIRDLRDDNAI